MIKHARLSVLKGAEDNSNYLQDSSCNLAFAQVKLTLIASVARLRIYSWNYKIIGLEGDLRGSFIIRIIGLIIW